MADRLATLAKKIRAAEDLWSLYMALIKFETALTPQFKDSPDTEGELKRYGIDICELPTFEGLAPKSTSEVWSWDKNSILVGAGPFSEWEIRDR